MVWLCSEPHKELEDSSQTFDLWCFKGQRNCPYKLYGDREFENEERETDDDDFSVCVCVCKHVCGCVCIGHALKKKLSS